MRAHTPKLKSEKSYGRAKIYALLMPSPDTARTAKMFRATSQVTAREIYSVLLAILERLESVDAHLLAAPSFIVSLPHCNVRSITALKALGGVADAAQAAELTGRTRANESLRLNELTRLGVCTKLKKGRKVIFKLKEFQ